MECKCVWKRMCESCICMSSWNSPQPLKNNFMFALGRVWKFGLTFTLFFHFKRHHFSQVCRSDPLAAKEWSKRNVNEKSGRGFYAWLMTVIFYFASPAPLTLSLCTPWDQLLKLIRVRLEGLYVVERFLQIFLKIAVRQWEDVGQQQRDIQNRASLLVPTQYSLRT